MDTGCVFLSTATARRTVPDELAAALDICHALAPRVQERLRSSFSQLLEASLAVLTGHRKNEHRTLQARLKDLYHTRTTIAHGTDLRGWDTASYDFTPRTSQNDDDLRTLLRITPFALAHWLREQAKTPLEPNGVKDFAQQNGRL
jgi:hypothetical protein